MKTFGFNVMEDMKSEDTITGQYDAEQQLWVGEAGSAAGFTRACVNGRCFTDSGGSSTARSSNRNGQRDNFVDSD